MNLEQIQSILGAEHRVEAGTIIIATVCAVCELSKHNSFSGMQLLHKQAPSTYIYIKPMD